MDCTITSTRWIKTRSRGMTLVEVMVATGVGSIVLVAVMALSLFSARTFAALTNYVQLDIKSRTALDTIATDIRQADALTAATSTSLTFRTMDPDTGVTNTLAYNYDSSRTTLTDRKSTRLNS